VADLSGSRGEDASGCRGRLTARVCMGRQVGLNLSDGGTQGCPQGFQALTHLCCDGCILLINLLLGLQTEIQTDAHACKHSLSMHFPPGMYSPEQLLECGPDVVSECTRLHSCGVCVQKRKVERHGGKPAHLVLLAALGLCEGDCSLENTQHQDAHATGMSRDVPSAAEVASLER